MHSKLENFFQTLTPNDPDWDAFIEKLPSSGKDLHYISNYFKVNENTYTDQISESFLMENEEIIIFKAFTKHKINNLDFAKNIEEDLFDIKSIYGYGGEIISLKKNLLEEQIRQHLGSYKEAFAAYCIKNNIISEFCLLHPLLSKNQKYLNSSYLKEIVCANLSLPHYKIWAQIEERQRKGIALAKRKGIVVKREILTDQAIQTFHTDYIETMHRKSANNNWMFPDNYFQNCRDFLGRENVSLFNAYLDDHVIASFFLIHAYDTCYYHFASNKHEYSKYNPTSLLIFETMMWAKAEGFKNFHMGGGVGPSGMDPLYKFKYSFAQKSIPLYYYTNIFNKEKYKKLTELSQESLNSNSNCTRSAFFPQYRG